jgi:hypothetical protein
MKRSVFGFIWTFFIMIGMLLILFIQNDSHAQRIFGPQDAIPVIQKVAPNELAAYQEAKTHGFGRMTADAGIALLHKIRRTWPQRIKQIGEKQTRFERWDLANMFAWEEVLECWKRTSDMQVRKTIILEWNQALSEGLLVRWQISALNHAWDSPSYSVFLTPEFIEVFKKTKDSSVIGAYCGLFEAHGRSSEKMLLQKKLDLLVSHPEPKNQDYLVSVNNIEQAIDTLDRWERSGEAGRIGPAERH